MENFGINLEIMIIRNKNAFSTELDFFLREMTVCLLTSHRVTLTLTVDIDGVNPVIKNGVIPNRRMVHAACVFPKPLRCHSRRESKMSVCMSMSERAL